LNYWVASGGRSRKGLDNKLKISILGNWKSW